VLHFVSFKFFFLGLNWIFGYMIAGLQASRVSAAFWRSRSLSNTNVPMVRCSLLAFWNSSWSTPEPWTRIDSTPMVTKEEKGFFFYSGSGSNRRQIRKPNEYQKTQSSSVFGSSFVKITQDINVIILNQIFQLIYLAFYRVRSGKSRFPIHFLSFGL